MADSRFLLVYANRRMTALAGIGFAAGLPNVLVSDTLSAWLSSVEVDVTTIGLFGLIGLPYALKFIWAPLLDRFLPPGLKQLGRRRGWLVLMQVLLAAGLLGLAMTSPSSNLLAVAALGIAIVFLSASQDIVADAYRTDVVERHELGAGAAVFVTGYRVAMIVGGAGAMIMARYIGWGAAYGAMAALMLLAVIVTWLAPQPPNALARPASLSEAVVQPIAQFIQQRGMWAIYIVPFIIVFRLPDFLAASMTMPLLIKHLQFTSEEIGWTRQAVGFFLTIVGALIGGGVIAQVGLIRSLVVFGVLQTASNIGFWALAQSEPQFWFMAAVIAIESFCGGLVAAGFVAFLMSCCDRRYSATQYALLSACMAAGKSLGGAITGYAVDWLGYAGFFLLTVMAGGPGLLMLLWLPNSLSAFQQRSQSHPQTMPPLPQPSPSTSDHPG